MRIKYSQAGDTIIEVLIALAVLGAIIGGGYAIATRSLNGVQIANERSEATKLAEGQLEAMKSAMGVAGDLDVLFAFGGPDMTDVNAKLPAVVKNGSLPDPAYPGFLTFCFKSDGDVKRFERGAVPDLQNIDRASDPYAAECIFNNRYHVAFDFNIEDISPLAAPGTMQQLKFTVHVTWNRSGGANGVPEQIQLYDKVVL